MSKRFPSAAAAGRLAASRPRRRGRIEVLEARSLLDSNPIVTVDTNFGSFEIELYPDAAPQTMANFLTYVPE